MAISRNAVALVAAALSACGGGHVPLPDLTTALRGDTSGLVGRGEYIVRDVAVCGHCHAADPLKNADGPLSGGFEFRNWRLGTIRASNLTSDSVTGIGAWTDAEIVRAIRNGEHRDGDVLAPVMPYEWFREMSDRDALAIARYLKSQPAVRNEVENDGNLIYGVARIFFLKVKDDVPRPVIARAPSAEYGAYLSQHVGLCADCHTPRGGLQSKPKKDELFAGTAKPPEGFPENPANLTPDDETGIGKWSESDFIDTIRTGRNPGGHELHEFMPYKYIRRMTDGDLRAIYRYLRTVPAKRNPVPRREEH